MELTVINVSYLRQCSYTANKMLRTPYRGYARARHIPARTLRERRMRPTTTRLTYQRELVELDAANVRHSRNAVG